MFIENLEETDVLLQYINTGKAVEVFDYEQVTFYFCNNMEDRGLFFTVLCLEETGVEIIHLCMFV